MIAVSLSVLPSGVVKSAWVYLYSVTFLTPSADFAASTACGVINWPVSDWMMKSVPTVLSS